MNRNAIILTAATLLAGGVAATGCRTAHSGVQTVEGVALGATAPRAVVYRTSAPSDSLVAIQLNGSRTSVVSFPAPSDLSPEAMPVKLPGGWLLDRRGIGPEASFTRFTYGGYSDADATPEVLIEAVVPEITVTQMVQLPVSASSVTPEQAAEYIANGFKGCKKLK